ncbi:MAG: hypothetical protein HZA90_03005 [Verrucomicrobia bacterium]|nr:hypothetical protein [Verrucomicrobiota bacterium]
MKQKILQAVVAVGRRSCRAGGERTTARREPRSTGAWVFVLMVCASAAAQVNSGSDGHDGAFNPTTNTVINMADHPDGIYHYTSVNIPLGVNVSFLPNANNSPVVWLVQSNCAINGTIKLDGSEYTPSGGLGGPGGYRGGNAGNSTTAGKGLGPGGGMAGVWGGHASFGTLGNTNYGTNQALGGSIYGNNFLVPLIGGSGGGGTSYGGNGYGGGGGGGAILIAASQTLTINGAISASGGNSAGSITYGTPPLVGGGAGSGGAIRLVATILNGTGSLSVAGGCAIFGYGGCQDQEKAGSGRIRFDALENKFGGWINGPITIGFQPIIIPTVGQGAQLTIRSIGGVPVSASPTGVLSMPDAVLSAQQDNPIPVIVDCANIPLNTQITVSVKPANGAAVSAVGYNNAGTLASSTATISINMPRGGGIIYATAATGN